MNDLEKKLKKQEYNRKYRETKKKKAETESIADSDESDATVIVHDVKNTVLPVATMLEEPEELVEEVEEVEEIEEVTRMTVDELEEYIQSRINKAVAETKTNNEVVSLKPKDSVVPSFFFQIMRNVGVSMMSTLSNVAVVALMGGAVGLITKMSQPRLNSSKTTTDQQEQNIAPPLTQPRDSQQAPFDPSMVQYGSLF